MNIKKYQLPNGAILHLNDMRSTSGDGSYSYEGLAILARYTGNVSQRDADSATARMVGVRAVVSQRRITLECNRIKTVSDAQEVADSFIQKLEYIYLQKDANMKRRKAQKSQSRSKQTVKHKPRIH